MSKIPPPAIDAAVAVDRLSKHYGDVAAVDGVSLRVARGSFFGLLGPNGAGKTTLIGILGGLARADGGHAAVLGHDVTTESLAVRSVIGIVPQELLYDPFFTVRESLVFQSKYYGIRRNEVWIETLLERLHLQEKSNTNTRRLSGGMKRRLMIAQALVHKPSVIVLDEPTAGVDINLRLSLWDFIRGLNRQGHTIILTTHYLEEAESLCDTVALMNKGKIAACGDTRALLSPLNHCTRVRLRVVNGTVPAHLIPARKEGDIWYFHISHYAEIEPLLAALREAGVEISEFSVSPPRLEDVFIDLMADK